MYQSFKSVMIPLSAVKGLGLTSNHIARTHGACHKRKNKIKTEKMVQKIRSLM